MQGTPVQLQGSVAENLLIRQGISRDIAAVVIHFAQSAVNHLSVHDLFDDIACPEGQEAMVVNLRQEFLAIVQLPEFARVMKKPQAALSQSERDALNRYRDVQQAFQRLQTAAIAAADDVEQPSIADYLTRGEMPPVGHWMTMRDMTDLLGEQMTEPTAITAPGNVTLPPCVAEDDSFPIMMGHVRAHAARLDDVIHFQCPMLVGYSHWVRVSGTMSADGVLSAEVHNTLGDASRNRSIGAEASDEPQYKGIANALAASPSTSGARLVCNGQQETGWSCGYMASAALLGAPLAQAEFVAVDWCIQTIAANKGLLLPTVMSTVVSIFTEKVLNDLESYIFPLLITRGIIRKDGSLLATKKKYDTPVDNIKLLLENLREHGLKDIDGDKEKRETALLMVNNSLEQLEAQILNIFELKKDTGTMKKFSRDLVPILRSITNLKLMRERIDAKYKILAKKQQLSHLQTEMGELISINKYSKSNGFHVKLSEYIEQYIFLPEDTNEANQVIDSIEKICGDRQLNIMPFCDIPVPNSETAAKSNRKIDECYEILIVPLKEFIAKNRQDIEQDQSIKKLVHTMQLLVELCAAGKNCKKTLLKKHVEDIKIVFASLLNSLTLNISSLSKTKPIVIPLYTSYSSFLEAMANSKPLKFEKLLKSIIDLQAQRDMAKQLLLTLESPSSISPAKSPVVSSNPGDIQCAQLAQKGKEPPPVSTCFFQNDNADPDMMKKLKRSMHALLKDAKSKASCDYLKISLDTAINYATSDVVDNKELLKRAIIDPLRDLHIANFDMPIKDRNLLNQLLLKLEDALTQDASLAVAPPMHLCLIL
jgi:hypothetical protein